MDGNPMDGRYDCRLDLPQTAHDRQSKSPIRRSRGLAAGVARCRCRGEEVFMDTASRPRSYDVGLLAQLLECGAYWLDQEFYKQIFA